MPPASRGLCGIVQADGYATYKRLAKAKGPNDGVLLAGCWSHVRRKFSELHANGVPASARAALANRRRSPPCNHAQDVLFAGSDGGSKTWATIATVLTTATLNGIDPYAWLELTQ